MSKHKYIVGEVKTDWGTFQPGENVMYVGSSFNGARVKEGVLLGYYSYVINESYQDSEGRWQSRPVNIQVPAVRCTKAQYAWQAVNHIARLPLGRIFKK